jgi:ABC-type nickel/cobalt efflux system permease component RcnA
MNVAVRGAVKQAMVLAVTATAWHTAIAWAFALTALTFGSTGGAQANEPCFRASSELSNR